MSRYLNPLNDFVLKTVFNEESKKYYLFFFKFCFKLSNEYTILDAEYLNTYQRPIACGCYCQRW